MYLFNIPISNPLMLNNNKEELNHKKAFIMYFLLAFYSLFVQF